MTGRPRLQPGGHPFEKGQIVAEDIMTQYEFRIFSEGRQIRQGLMNRLPAGPLEGSALINGADMPDLRSCFRDFDIERQHPRHELIKFIS